MESKIDKIIIIQLPYLNENICYDQKINMDLIFLCINLKIKCNRLILTFKIL